MDGMKSLSARVIGAVLVFFLGVCSMAGAQSLPGNQPEQDACNALILCGNTFTTPYSYQGIGRVNDLRTTPCGAGEDHAMWMKLTVSTPGRIVFSIIPASPQDDYDFAVLNITGGSCSNLSAANVVRCNFNNNQPGSNVNGIVGLSTTATSPFVQGGTFGTPFCSHINATAGQVYLIMINNFGNYQTGGPSSGFTIDFAGSTATFNRPEPPRLQSIVPPVCNNRSEITMQLSAEVRCSSIAANGSDFILTPSGTIASASGINCAAGRPGYTDKVRLVFSSPLSPGNYMVRAAQGSDGNTLLDLCDNALRLPDQLSFQVPALAATVNMTRCTSQLPFNWNGINVTAGGAAAAVARTTTAAGCDSFTTLNLTVIPNPRHTVTLNICNGQLPFVWNGITVTSGGNGVATYNSPRPNGCDSITVLNLNVQPGISHTVLMNRCDGQLPFIWNGIPVNSPGPAAAVYRTRSSATGCDSIVTLNLTVITPAFDSLSLSGCNEVYYGNNRYTSDRVVRDTIRSREGCDSTYRVIRIKVHQAPPPITLSIDTAGCGIVRFNGMNYTKDTVIRSVIPDQHGCDSIYRIVTIVVHPDRPDTVRIDTTACYQVIFEGNVYDHDTVLKKVYVSRVGCDSMIRLVYVDVEELSLKLTASYLRIVKGESVDLFSSGDLSYRVIRWSPANWFPLKQAASQRIKPDQSGRIVVVAESFHGCMDSAAVWITVDSLDPRGFLPNAFTPNGDGLNDRFLPKFSSERGHEIVNFRVADRWGKIVYVSYGTKTIGWDGTYNNQGTPAEMGTYYYYLDVRFVNGEHKVYKGDVTLLR